MYPGDILEAIEGKIGDSLTGLSDVITRLLKKTEGLEAYFIGGGFMQV